MPTTTRAQIPNEVDAFYDRLLLLRVLPYFIHCKFGQRRPIPRNSGTATIRFRRYTNLTPATTPLTEGVTPAGSSLASTELTATALQYGDFVTVSDVLDFASQDPVLIEAMDLLADQAAQTLDILCRDIINAGTSVIYPSTYVARISITSADLITATLISKAIRTLKRNNARRLLPMVNSSQNVATEGVDKGFFGIVHPDVTFTLQDLPGFIEVKDYPNQSGVLENEVGSYKQVRFVETSQAKIFVGLGAAGIDVYSTLIMGADAYGVTEISGEGLKSIRKAFGSAGTADPLDQRGTSGWKATHVTKILNDNFMVRVETAAAA